MELKEFRNKLNDHESHLKDELGKIRTNLASSALVEDISVDYYGAPTPIKQLATITVQKPATIVIEPWDKKGLNTIEKALSVADLGAAPNVNDNRILVNLPPMSEERREQIAASIKEKAEQVRISARQDREEAINCYKKLQSEGKISEDEFAAKKNEIQKALDEYNNKIELVVLAKEKEIMTI